MKVLHKIILVFVIISLFFLWNEQKKMKPYYNITQKLPSDMELKFLSFGDEQFLYRILSFNLQKMGNVFGYVAGIDEYDFFILKEWFKKLSIMDKKSNFIQNIAINFFSVTKNYDNLIYISNYFDFLVENNIGNKRENILNSAVLLCRAKKIDEGIKTSIPLMYFEDKDITLWMKYLSSLMAFRYNKICLAKKFLINFDKNKEMSRFYELNWNEEEIKLQEMIANKLNNIKNYGKC